MGVESEANDSTASPALTHTPGFAIIVQKFCQSAGWCMRLISWNVNGIRAVHKKGFLEWFESEQPDVLCIQETKAHESQLPAALKQVEGYTAWFSEPERKGYSGVATVHPA